MTSDRIKQIQMATASPDSVSVMLALKQVWNECEQEFKTERDSLKEDVAMWRGKAVQEKTKVLELQLERDSLKEQVENLEHILKMRTMALQVANELNERKNTQLSTLQSQADKLAVEFHEWMRVLPRLIHVGGMDNPYYYNEKYYNVSELYELFKQSKH